MKFSWRYFIILFFAAPLLAASSSILQLDEANNQVVVSHPFPRLWKLNDPVCFKREEKALGCAVIISLTLKSGVAAPAETETELGKTLAAGPVLRVSDLQMDDEVSAVQEFERIRTSPAWANLTLGALYLSPALDFSYLLDPYFAVSIQSLVLVDPGFFALSLKGYGALISLTHYSDLNFANFWVSAGIGILPLTVSNSGGSQEVTIPFLKATAGWRWLWPSGFNIGFGAGLFILTNTSVGKLNTHLPTLWPAWQLDLGYLL